MPTARQSASILQRLRESVRPPIAAAALAAILASREITRSYDYDESVTLAFFVRRDSILEAVSSQRVFNNHPAFTALAWILNRIGLTGEAWFRAPAIVAGCACVVLVTRWATNRRGPVAGWLCAAIICTNPMFIRLMGQGRGYSLAALAVSGLALVSTRFDRDSDTFTPPVAAWTALGLLAHLYSVLAVFGLTVFVANRRPTALRAWLRSVGAGALLTAPIYLTMAGTVFSSARGRRGELDLGFPADVVHDLLGWWPALVPAAVLVGALSVGNPSLRRPAISVMVSLAVIVVVVRPVDLYPRFLVWMVPLLAMAAASQAARPAVLCAACALVGLSVVPLARPVEDSGLREVAALETSLKSEGVQLCAHGYFWEALQSYGEIPPDAPTEQCDGLLVMAVDAPRMTPPGLVARAVPGGAGACVIAKPSDVARQTALRAPCPEH